VHPRDFENAALADAWLAVLRADQQQVSGEQRFSRMSVFTLAPADRLPRAPGGLRRVPTTSIRASASHSPDRLPQLFDGDLDSRWLTAVPQTGNEWLQIDFDRPRDVGLLRLRMAERSFGDYPRSLAVDAVSGEQVRAVFEGSVLSQMAQGLIDEGPYPNIDLPIPGGPIRALRLRQTGASARFFWSVHELEVWER
jgi:hypothetical protein